MPSTKDKTEALQEAKDDVGKHSALEALMHMEGGKILIAEAIDDINNSMGVLISQYSTMTDSELRAQCALLAVNVELFNKLTNAPKKKAFALEELRELGEKIEPDKE